jgi:hypothetical protein
MHGKRLVRPHRTLVNFIERCAEKLEDGRARVWRKIKTDWLSSIG